MLSIWTQELKLFQIHLVQEKYVETQQPMSFIQENKDLEQIWLNGQMDINCKVPCLALQATQ